MPVKDSIETHVDYVRGYVSDNFLPDTCNIYPFVTVPDGSGGYAEELGEARTYAGFEDIPCRVDPVRLYKNEEVFDQDTVITEYIIALPFDVEINQGDRVVYKERNLEMVRAIDLHSWNIVKRIHVSDLSANQ